jgi:hypothetical protein
MFTLTRLRGAATLGKRYRADLYLLEVGQLAEERNLGYGHREAQAFENGQVRC